MKLTTLFVILAALAPSAATPERPPIVGIANIAVKVKDLSDHQYYTPLSSSQPAKICPAIWWDML